MLVIITIFVFFFFSLLAQCLPSEKAPAQQRSQVSHQVTGKWIVWAQNLVGSKEGQM